MDIAVYTHEARYGRKILVGGKIGVIVPQQKRRKEIGP
jgi:hypothetical protein